MKNIPFVDLYAQYKSIQPQIDSAVQKTIEQSAYIGGQAVKEFEKAFAAYIGTEYMISCANGTDSIEILLTAFGIGPGDEVIVPAASWISTSEAVSTVGAVPIFVDIETEFYTINPALIAEKITKNTKAIIPVHLYGHPANMPAIMQIAEKHKLVVIEDCAQAHGAAINGKKVGTFGHAASFSFYPGKNLGAYGDAGCMTTNDASIAAKAAMIANHGQQGKHNHLMEGRNSRLDGLQAAVLQAKLPFLEEWTEARIKNAGLYNQYLQNKNIFQPFAKEDYRHVYHLYVIRTEKRNELQMLLKDAGIETAIHYPKALPFLNCYSNRNFTAHDFPVAFEYQEQILSLPMYAELTEDSIQYIASCIH
jgi:dTDP-4-amino-4,6-dideoxygalactose transaminase